MTELLLSSAFNHERGQGDQEAAPFAVGGVAAAGSEARDLQSRRRQVATTISDYRPLNQVDINEDRLACPVGVKSNDVAYDLATCRIHADGGMAFHRWDGIPRRAGGQLRKYTEGGSSWPLARSVRRFRIRTNATAARACRNIAQAIESLEDVATALRLQPLQRFPNRRFVVPRPVVDVAHRYLQDSFRDRNVTRPERSPINSGLLLRTGGGWHGAGACGVASDEIADYVIAAIYPHSKNLEATRARSLDQWQWAPLGRVSGSTLGIIGFGAISEALARKALALGLNVVASRRRPLPSTIEGVTLVADPADVAAAADHLVLALPATAETRHLIDAKLLARAKPDAHLINVARGSVLNQEALIAVLDNGPLGFATLDVTEPEPLPAAHPLWTHPKVRLTPHVSSNHTNVRHVLFDKVAANLDRFARGEIPGDIVDRAAGY